LSTKEKISIEGPKIGYQLSDKKWIPEPTLVFSQTPPQMKLSSPSNKDN